MISTEELFTGVRWKILKALAEKGNMTANELATKTNTSLPGISQATKLLEAYGYIAAKSVPRNNPGKPQLTYSLKKNNVQITACVEGFAERITVNPSPMQISLIRTFQLPIDEQQWVQKLLLTNDHLLESIEAIAYVRTEKDETHILVITNTVDSYRKQYSSITLESGKEKRKVVSWSHDFKEFREGVSRKEAYFLDLVRKAVVIYDPAQLILRSQHGEV